MVGAVGAWWCPRGRFAPIRLGKLRGGGFVYVRTNRDGRMSELIGQESERAKVESWRLHVLLEAGYPLPLAERIAVSAVDLHYAVELITLGCSPETAVEILL
jgi:hypothetical protein